MPSIELLNNVRTEDITHSSVIIAPSLNFVLRVRPEQIAEEACVWYILWSMLLIDNFEVVQIWTESSMHTQNSVINDCCRWKHVEACAELLPNFDSVSSFALIVEPIHSIDRLAFMVTSEQEEIIWVFDFVCQH
jgi:hypothetical protein